MFTKLTFTFLSPNPSCKYNNNNNNNNKFILLQDFVKRRGAYRVLVGKPEGQRPL